MGRAVASVATLSIVGLTGCETKSFLDPGELGRYEKTPLVVPILDELVIGLESDKGVFGQSRDVKAEDLIVDNSDYRIGPNDAVQVEIADLEQPGQPTIKVKRVTESGNVSLPFIGSVKAKGLTEAELEAAVSKAYADKEILPDAQVSVVVVEAQNRVYSVSGAVNQAGPYGLPRSDFRLLDALTVARGTTIEVGISDIYVIRQKSDGLNPTGPTPVVPLDSTLDGSDPLVPTSKNNLRGDDRRTGNRQTVVSGLLMAIQPAPTEPAPAQPPVEGSVEEARAKAEAALEATKAAAEEAQVPVASDPMTPTAPGEVSDRVIQIEGAGTQPAGPVDEDPMTPNPVDAAPTEVDPMIPGESPMTPAPFEGEGLRLNPPTDAAPLGGPSTDEQPFEFQSPAEPSDREVIRVPFGELKRGALRFNIVIKPNDLIFVPSPPAGTYYLSGHVLRGGAYGVPADGITLKQAIASGGGLDQVAIPARTDIIRRIGANQEVFVRVDLDRIAAGLEPDIFIKPNDQINVGTNAFAPFLASIRNGFRLTYGFGFIYDRNFANDNNNNNN